MKCEFHISHGPFNPRHELEICGTHWPGVSILTFGFVSKVGEELIDQNDARSFEIGSFRFYDGNSHTNYASQGAFFVLSNRIIFKM